MKVNWWVLASLVISILAFAVSAATYYSNYLRPISLKIRDTGRYQITKNPYTEPLEPAVILDLLFINEGAVYGVVEDVAVILNTPSGGRVLFRSFLEVIDRTLHDERNIEPLKTAPFASFGLKGGESVLKSLFFIRKSPSDYMSFVAGRYCATIFARDASGKGWTEFKGPAFVVAADDAEFVNAVRSVVLPSGQRAVPWRARGNPTYDANELLGGLEKKL